MKKIKIYLMIAVMGTLGVFATSCSGDDEPSTQEAPQWSVANSPEFSVSMTAVVILPDYLQKYYQGGDQLAAFVGDECRGTGLEIDGKYYILIKGAARETGKVTFKYYSHANKYLYSTGELMPFEADEIYGTVDAPKTLPLVIVK